MQLRVPMNLVKVLAGLKEVVDGSTTLRGHSLYGLSLSVG